jgi:hypothetical protein
MKISKLVALAAVLPIAACLVWIASSIPGGDQRFLASVFIALGLTILVFRRRFGRGVAKRFGRAPPFSNPIRLQDEDMIFFCVGLGLSFVVSGIVAMAR